MVFDRHNGIALGGPDYIHEGSFPFRSTAILVFYLLSSATLTLTICRSLYQRHQLSRQNQRQPESSTVNLYHVTIFVALALFSLWTTWSNMFAFFAYSYRDWACRTNYTSSVISWSMEDRTSIRSILNLVSGWLTDIDLWLKGTKLFREAWETVIETPYRYWWSGQIFWWTTAWSLYLGVMGRRYNIPYLWMYMLLGQIVAISFAQNLFYLAIILYASSASTSKATSKSESTALSATPDKNAHSQSLFIYDLLRLVPIIISLSSTAIVPLTVHTRYFMPILLIPHLLLFIPTLPIWNAPRDQHNTNIKPFYTRAFTAQAFQWIFIAHSIFVSVATYTAFVSEAPVPMRRAVHMTGQTATGACAMEPAQQLSAENGEIVGALRRLLGTIYEHPAVSSVSWDVICCTISGFAWWMVVNRLDFERAVGGDFDHGEEGSKKKEG